MAATNVYNKPIGTVPRQVQLHQVIALFMSTSIYLSLIMLIKHKEKIKGTFRIR
jgi:hypothetical protein